MGDLAAGAQDTEPGSGRRVPAWVLVPAAVIGSLGALFLVVLLLFLATGYDDPETAETAGTSDTPASSVTTVAETPTPTVPETTTTTAAPAPTPIPGLTTSSVQGHLISQGWFCGISDRQPAEGYVVSACRIVSPSGTPVVVSTYGNPADEVVFVEVSALTHDDARWMESVAGLVHADAAAWVQEIASSRPPESHWTTTVESVRLELFGNPQTATPYWTLKIGIEP